jgi:hypothetical protein
MKADHIVTFDDNSDNYRTIAYKCQAIAREGPSSSSCWQDEATVGQE